MMRPSASRIAPASSSLASTTMVKSALRNQFDSHHSKIYAVEFAPTGNLMLSAGGDGAVIVSNSPRASSSPLTLIGNCAASSAHHGTVGRGSGLAMARPSCRWPASAPALKDKLGPVTPADRCSAALAAMAGSLCAGELSAAGRLRSPRPPRDRRARSGARTA